jgi:hypothetical protein
MHKLNIGIAGAGIGGLAAASLLADQGHTITIIDQFGTPEPVGSGLVIQPVGQAVLAQIGALDLAMSRGNKILHMLGHEANNGRRVLDVWYDRSTNNPERFGLAIHRASLFDALYQAALSRDITMVPSAIVTNRVGQSLLLKSGSLLGPFNLIIDSLGASSPLSPLKSRDLPYGAIWGTVNWHPHNLAKSIAALIA